jgi:probable F420-dependent oxidoreductase
MSTTRTSSPQVSIQLRTFAAEDPGGWERLVQTVVAADEVGIDRVVLADHVVFGDDLSDYGDPGRGGVAGGRQPTGPDGHWLEPLTTIAYLSALTTNIRFGTGILLAALRRPVVLAKMAANIDVLSGGRLDLGVGVGWQEAEYAAAGLDFSRRGRLLNDSLEVCQTLWSEQAASVDVDSLRFDAIHMMPKPVGRGVPLWVSGTVNPRSMDRLARFGSGWIPWGRSAADLALGISEMRSAVAERGRDPDDIEIVGNLRVAIDDGGAIDIGATREAIGELAEIGVSDVRAGVKLPDEPDEERAVLAELVAAFASGS